MTGALYTRQMHRQSVSSGSVQQKRRRGKKKRLTTTNLAINGNTNAEKKIQTSNDNQTRDRSLGRAIGGQASEKLVPFTKVYVKNLDDSYDSDDKVEQLFRPFGTVTHVRLITDESGHSKGFAYVTFEEPDMALKACQALNRMRTPSGQRLYVDRAFTAKERRERTDRLRNSGVWRVFVKSLDKGVDDKVLFDEFSSFGSILSYKVARNESGHSLGYGVVVYLSEESAQRAIDVANGKLVNGRSVFVEKFVPLYERQRLESQRTGRRLFVRNFKTEEQLRQCFEVYGVIEDIEIVSDKGFGYVTFADQTMADTALSDVTNNRIFVTNRRLVAKKAIPKKNRDSQFKAVNQFECQICFDIKNTDSLLAYGCEHQFCRDCVKNYLESIISDGTIDGLKCPETGCQRSADESLIKRLVSKQTYQRYEKLMLKEATKDMDDIINCPNGKCDALLEIEIYRLRAYCHKCRIAYCTNCLKKYHGNDPCPASDEEKRKQERESEQFISQNCKNCPECRSPIQKNEGCDHMTCKNCKHEFCWLCLANWLPLKVYHPCYMRDVRPDTPQVRPAPNVVPNRSQTGNDRVIPVRNFDLLARDVLTARRTPNVRDNIPTPRVTDQIQPIRNVYVPTHRDPDVQIIRASMGTNNSVTTNVLTNTRRSVPQTVDRPITFNIPVSPRTITRISSVRTVRPSVRQLPTEPLLTTHTTRQRVEERVRPSSVWPINPLLMFSPSAYRYTERPIRQKKSLMSRIFRQLFGIRNPI